MGSRLIIVGPSAVGRVIWVYLLARYHFTEAPHKNSNRYHFFSTELIPCLMGGYGENAESLMCQDHSFKGGIIYRGGDLYNGGVIFE